MFSKGQHELLEPRTILVIAIACITLLIGNVQGDAQITFEGVNKSNIFLPNQDIGVKWSLQLPFEYESYNVLVYNMSTQKPIKDSKFDFKTGEFNLGEDVFSRFISGTYYVLLTAHPRSDDRITPPFSYPARFTIAPPTNIKIIKYSDMNGNGKRDANESGLPGWKFRYGRAGESISKLTLDTGEDGSVVITDPVVGDYEIEEIPQNGWNNTDSSLKHVTVIDGNSTVVEFGNIPSGSLKITCFADFNGNGTLDGSDYPISGWRFVITGENLNQSVSTGTDGAAIAILKPGRYAIAQSDSNCWKASRGISQIVIVKPAEIATVSFGNKPQANISILAYLDVNENGKYDTGEGMPDVTFAVNGPQGTSNLVSGKNDFTRYTGIPGEYNVTAIAPDGFVYKTLNHQTETLKPCDDKQVLFGFESKPIRIDNLVPKNNDHIGSRDVSFTWKTSEVTSGELYLKRENESNYSIIRGFGGIEHSINRSNLTRNTWYVYKVKSEKGSRSIESKETRFFIDNGISFTQRTYEFNIDQDYDQHCSVSVKNTDSKSHSVQVNILNNTNRDIYLGFMGEGSADMVLSLAPGETKDLELVIHAQDAKLKRYSFVANLTNLGQEEIVDYARINVNIRETPIDFSFEEIGSDPVNLTKIFRVKNLKDPIKDLTITSDDSLGKDAVLQPQINHAFLGKDGSIEFSVSPIWSKEIGSIKGVLTASAGAIKKDLSVNFSCEEGTYLYDVVLHRPLLHFDLNIRQCINAYYPIEGIFLLPPGLTEGNISYAKFGMELDALEGSLTPYDVWVKINDHEVGRRSKDVYSGYFEYNIDPANLAYTIAGSAVNNYSILDTMPQQYHTYITNARVQMCLKELKLKICAKNQQQAENIAWNSPWIYRTSNRLNVTILEPMNGGNLSFGLPATIKVKVLGNFGGERYTSVWTKFNNRSITPLIEQYNAGMTEEGIYAANWKPDEYGAGNITVTASNCITSGSDTVSIRVPIPTPNSTKIGKNGQGGLESLAVSKSLYPNFLDVSKMDTENGNVIKYTITIVPIRGAKFKDVKVIDNLPAYMTLNNSSLRDKANVQLNHEAWNWSTTNITWDIGDLDRQKSLKFDAVFHWKLPADAQQLPGTSPPISMVTYSSLDGVKSRVDIPEEEIRIVAGTQQGTNRPAPGFEALFAAIGISLAGYLYRRRVN